MLNIGERVIIINPTSKNYGDVVNIVDIDYGDIVCYYTSASDEAFVIGDLAKI